MNTIRYYDRLKALACIAVVALHCFFGNFTSAVKLDLLMGRNLMMWAVPIFVMVTGALLLNPDRTITPRKLSRYTLRMVIALVVFTFAFSLFDWWISDQPFTGSVLTSAVKNIFYGTGWKHMWYLYLMIGVYLTLPVFRGFTRSASDKELIYAVVLFFVASSVIPSVYTFLEGQNPFYILTYTIYPLYLVLGYVLSKGIIKLRLGVSTILSVIGVGGIALLTYLGYKQGSQHMLDLVANYSCPSIVIACVGIFGLFMNSRDMKIIDKVCHEISKCSFGVYLLHFAVIKYIVVVIHPKRPIIPLQILVSFAIPFLITWIYNFLVKVIKREVK